MNHQNPKTDKTNQIVLTAPARIEIVTGAETIRRGQSLCRAVWNAAVQTQSAMGYPGRWRLWSLLRPDWRTLNDRCFGYTLLDYHIAWQGWKTRRVDNPRERPPGECRDPRPLVFEVGRNARPLGAWTYRLTVLGAAEANRQVEVKLQVRPGVKMEQISLIRLLPDGRGQIVYRRAVNREPAGSGWAGIDLGVVNLTT